MGDNGVGKALDSLGGAVTSPAKLVFVSYVVLAAMGKIGVEAWQFLLLAVAFFVAQVLHDDYCRIVLNGWANLKIAREEAAKPRPG